MREELLFNASVKVVVPEMFKKHKEIRAMNVELFVNEVEGIVYNITRNDVMDPKDLLEYVGIKKTILLRNIDGNSLKMEIFKSDKYEIYCLQQENENEGMKLKQYSYMYKIKNYYYTSSLVFVKEDNQVRQEVEESIKAMIILNLEN